MVSIKEKKEFIRYFLNSYQVKRREAVWILNYILSHDQLVEKAHFVSNAVNYSRGILISTHCVDDVPFRYYKENIMTTDAEKSFHDIRLNSEKDIYIQLNFHNKYKDYKYIGVLEDEGDSIHEEFAQGEYSIADEFIEYCLHETRVNNLKEKIDKAIENSDKQKFMELTNELNLINQEFPRIKIVKSAVLK
ncbi:hypothetical protein CHH83_02255 [Bacillus sp. 7586-K]|nr:hypothetical protein CHH83_02255 [Bacillus sp. 7586-K]